MRVKRRFTNLNTIPRLSILEDHHPGWFVLDCMEQFRTFEDFYDHVAPLCHKVCEGEWVIDYFGVYFELESDGLMVRLAF